ncbi:Endonuclease/exonuclease/phosphatase [Trema orientale]|uniref:Endonuclease/exonuclease/phosphatase n=1 Tax=Trema orientale TaxID=63057 RepID=A0A2P5ENQ4_TREOI|nr:Endonuclease/exonuclease/phosphatase [Trema orientale]
MGAVNMRNMVYDEDTQEIQGLSFSPTQSGAESRGTTLGKLEIHTNECNFCFGALIGTTKKIKLKTRSQIQGDLGFTGPRLTWNNGWGSASNIQERLDHFLVSENWCDWYPNSKVSNLDFWGSDHGFCVWTHPSQTSNGLAGEANLGLNLSG